MASSKFNLLDALQEAAKLDAQLTATRKAHCGLLITFQSAHPARNKLDSRGSNSLDILQQASKLLDYMPSWLRRAELIAGHQQLCRLSSQR